MCDADYNILFAAIRKIICDKLFLNLQVLSNHIKFCRY